MDALGGHHQRVEDLARAGFDVVHPFSAMLLGMGGPERLALLLGNTRALWPAFTEAMRDPALAAEADPLDRYTERTFEAVFPGARIYYGHRRYDGAFVPLARLAAQTGLGALAPNHLVLHPIYGPWFALRAVVLLDGAQPPMPPPVHAPCDCGPECTWALTKALSTMRWQDWLEVRTTCGPQAYRYSDEQIAYHYTRAKLLNG